MRVDAKKALGLGLGAIMLASCSTTPSGPGGAPLGDPDSAYSQGLGKRARFDGDSMGATYTTKAPHDQIYYFAFDNSQVAEKYMASIDAQARYLMSHPRARILLAGHTDERGSREYNVALGERRANSVADIFRLAGVPRSQVRVVSYGEERPADSGHDASAWRLNRRVELTYEATR